MKPKRYIIPIFVPHVGCPNDCVFCNQRRISGKIEPATADTVRFEIESAMTYIPENAETEAAFYGGSFTAIEPSQQEELLSAVHEYLKNGKISSVRLSTRPDAIDDDVIARLKKYGVKTVELGAQSMCDDVLELSNRGHTAKAVYDASELIKESGLELVLQMMTGLPGDTPEKSIETAKKIASIHPNGVRVYPTVIVRDTRLCDMYLEGTYSEHTVENAVELCAEISDIFENAGIPIIRMGLNPTEELTNVSAVGGAYHPALGQLVQSRGYRRLAERLISELEDVKSIDTVTFSVKKGQISTFVGQKKENMLYLTEKYGIKIKFTERETEDKLSVLSVERKNKV